MCFSWGWTLTQAFGSNFFFYLNTSTFTSSILAFRLLSAGVNKCISDQCPLFAMTFYIIVLIPRQIMSGDNKNQSWMIWFLWATKESKSNTWKYSNVLHLKKKKMKYLSRTIRSKASETWEVKLLGALSALSSDTGERKVQLWIKEIKTQWMTEHTEELAGQITAE